MRTSRLPAIPSAIENDIKPAKDFQFLNPFSPAFAEAVADCDPEALALAKRLEELARGPFDFPRN